MRFPLSTLAWLLAGLAVHPVPAQGGGAAADQWPAIRRFLSTEPPSDTPVLGLVIAGAYPVDVQLPVAGSLVTLHDIIGKGDAAQLLQGGIDARAVDADLAAGGVPARLRAVVLGAMNLSTFESGVARKQNDLALRGKAGARAEAVAASERRDAALSLATWAMLELFRYEGGDFSPGALRARAADLVPGIDWSRLESQLRSVAGASVSDGDDLDGASQGTHLVPASITFEPAHLKVRTGEPDALEPGQDGGGVEVFIWHPNIYQSGVGMDAVRVRVDMPTPAVGLPPWSAVRNAMPAMLYAPENYARFDPRGDARAIFTVLLRVAYAGFAQAQETFRSDLADATGENRARFAALRDKAMNVSPSAGMPARLRASAFSYLAAKMWMNGLRVTLTRQAGAAALADAGAVPDDTLGF